MVVLFFATGKNKSSTYTNKEYAEHIKKGILKEDANKCMGIELTVMKDLQLANLDSMLKTSDEILKVQHDFENFLRGLEKKFQDLDQNYKLTVNLKNKPYKIKEAILAFSWDDQKYPKSGKTIDQIIERLNEKLNTTRTNFKNKSDDYYAETEKLKQKKKGELEAKSYMKKDYREILKNKTEQMVKTKYLTSLLVFVPNNMLDTFKAKYQNLLADTVVPGSGLQLCNNEDEKVTLWRVVLMHHKKDEYVNELRKVIKANSKEYDEKEISILPQLLMEQNTIEANIEEKRVSLNNYFSRKTLSNQCQATIARFITPLFIFYI